MVTPNRNTIVTHLYRTGDNSCFYSVCGSFDGIISRFCPRSRHRRYPRGSPRSPCNDVPVHACPLLFFSDFFVGRMINPFSQNVNRFIGDFGVRFFRFSLIPPFSAFFAPFPFSQISYNIGMFAQKQRPPMQLAQTAFALFYFLF